MKRQLVIVGAGPAGVSAALWAKSLHLEVLLIEALGETGGQLLNVHFHPRELPGLLDGDGRAIAAAYARQLTEAGVVLRHDARAEAIESASVLEAQAGGGSVLRLAGGERVVTQALLVACGTRRRTLGISGEREFEGRGLSTSATRDRERLAGSSVVVVGAGDAAFENALLLVSLGCDVTLLARGAVRARREFRARLDREPRARVLERTRVLAVIGDRQVRALRVVDALGERELECAGVVVKVGVVPNTEWCRDVLAHDAEGYLVVDGGLATSRPRVWAAGDVTRPLLASVPVAVGQGALAAAAIRAALLGR